MSKIESAISSQTVSSTHTEQPVSTTDTDEHSPGTSFFVIGGIINITMILAYFVWAVYAWKKADKQKRR